MKNFKVGIQLYSLREEIAKKGMDEILGEVKSIGYDCVEFAGYAGHSAEEIKAMLDKHGLECISVHQTPDIFEKEGQSAIDFLKVIGAKYCAVPWYPKDKLAGSEEWENTVAMFTKVSKALKENGIQMLYHNHDFEFEKYEDKYIIDWLFDTMPENSINPEFDTGWVTYSGENPAVYIEKYSGRTQVLHLKDFYAKRLKSGPVYALINDKGEAEGGGTLEDNGFMYKPCGYGLLDVPSILAAAEKSGTECVIVEFDESPEHTPLEDAKLSREYLKSLGL